MSKIFFYLRFLINFYFGFYIYKNKFILKEELYFVKEIRVRLLNYKCFLYFLFLFENDIISCENIHNEKKTYFCYIYMIIATYALTYNNVTVGYNVYFD